MPRSSFYQQMCRCGSPEPARVSITIYGSTLRTKPRQKSRTITLYVCQSCIKRPKPKARDGIIAAILVAATEALKPQKAVHTKHNGGKKK